MYASLLLYVLGGLVLFRVVVSVVQTVASPLRGIPGPFTARFSRLWYFNRVNKGHFEKDNTTLHKKYGPIIRVAPNHYSIDDLAAVKPIYGIATQFRKSDWYYGWQYVPTGSPDAHELTI